jgi:hypothetical protein
MITPIIGRYQSLVKANPTTVNGSKVVEAKTVKALTPEFWGGWICTRSEFTPADVKAMVEHDQEQPQQLGVFACQMSLTLALDILGVPMTEELLYMVLNALDKGNGYRLRGLRAKMGFSTVDGRLNWRHGSFSMKFGADGRSERATEVDHVEAGPEGLPPHVIITRGAQFIKPYSDFDCAVHIPPLPPFKLATFYEERWGKNCGPNDMPYYTGKSQGWKDYVQFYSDKLMIKKQAASGAGVVEKVATAMQEVDKAKKRALMDKARSQALVAMEQKRRRRSLTAAAAVEVPPVEDVEVEGAGGDEAAAAEEVPPGDEEDAD